MVGTLKYRYFKNRALQENQTILIAEDRSFESYGTSLNWRLSHAWTLAGSLNMNRQQYQGRDAATARIFSISAVYRGAKIATSY